MNWSRIYNSHCLCLVGIIAVLCWPCHLTAAELPSSTDGPPAAPAVTVDTPPRIDGVLDDACWAKAMHIEGFWRQRVDAPELAATEAWLCCDGEAIYVAFRCHDARPDEITARQKKRQGDIGRDDCVEFALDVEDAGINFYWFTVTPAGTQIDGVPGGTSEKIQWRGDWQAAARIDEGGWSAEMAIPFSILRYPQGQECFRFRLSRRLSREDDWSAWPACWARRQDGSECARWTQVELPPARFRYVLMPYLLSVTSEDPKEREALAGGVDFRGTLPSGIVTLATYRPDFRNIEDVVESIDFTFVERRLPEYRPFFREGEGYGPPDMLFYSRRVEEVDWGAKAFGTVGSHRFSVLDASQSGGENHLAWNYEHLFGTEGSLRFSGVDRRVPGDPDNRASGVGTHWQQTGTKGGRWIGGDWYRSRTEGEAGDDTAMEMGLGTWVKQGFDWSVHHSRTGADFQADDGYVPETGVERSWADLWYGRSYDEGPLLDQWMMFSPSMGKSLEGDRRELWFAWAPTWRNGWHAWVEVTEAERDGFDVKRRFVGPDWNSDDIYHKGHVGYEWGEQYGQPYRYWRFKQAFRPTRRLSGQVQISQVYVASLDDDGNVLPPERSQQFVLTTTYDVSDEAAISARIVRESGNTNMYAAYRRRVREGMDLLVVLGDPNAEEWVSRLAIKGVWCF